MSYQDRDLSLRWYIGMLGIGLTVWAWLMAYLIVMAHIQDMEWLVTWLSWGAIGCLTLVLILPSERGHEKETRQEGKIRSNTKKYE